MMNGGVACSRLLAGLSLMAVGVALAGCSPSEGAAAGEAVRNGSKAAKPVVGGSGAVGGGCLASDKIC
jgi:hypothetical protein